MIVASVPTEKGEAMAENYKRLYEQMKKLVAMYQDEIVPGMRKQLENCVEVVPCAECTKSGCCIIEERLVTARAKDRYCGLGERRNDV